MFKHILLKKCQKMELHFLWLLIIEIGAVVTLDGFPFYTNVTRVMEMGDIFTQLCSRNCGVYNAYCYGSTGCCRCQCEYGRTLYKDSISMIRCVTNPLEGEDCQLRFSGSRNSNQLISVKINKTPGFHNIGEIATPKEKKFSCKIINNKCFYWNLTYWAPLFTDGRTEVDLHMVFERRDYYAIYLDSTNGDSLYRGLLIKLQIKCRHINSCVMFKTLGRKSYIVPFANDIPDTFPTITDFPLSTPSPERIEMNSENALLLAVIIISVLIVVAACVVIMLLCWKKSRRKHGMSNSLSHKKKKTSKKRLLKNEIIYQTPNVACTSNTSNYLQPTDSLNKTDTNPYSDLNPVRDQKKKPEFQYDYAKVDGVLNNKTGCSKHVYAECKGTPHYTDPDKMFTASPYIDPDEIPRANPPGYTRLNPERALPQEHEKPGYSPLSSEINSDSKTYSGLTTCVPAPGYVPLYDVQKTGNGSPKYFELSKEEPTTPVDEDEVAI